MQAGRHGRNTDGHGRVVAVAGIHCPDGIENGEAVLNDPLHIALLHHRKEAVAVQLFYQAVVFLGKGLDDMLDLPHGAAALVFLGIGKQLGVVINEHGKHIGPGIKVFLGIVLQVVIIHQTDDGQRLLGGAGVHEEHGVVPLPYHDIPAFGAAFGLPIQSGYQLRYIMPKQLLPGEHPLLGGGIAPHHLTAFPHDEGRHGQGQHGVAHDVLQRILQSSKAAAVLPGDNGHPDDAPKGEQCPRPQADIEQGHIVAGGDGGHQAAGHYQHRKNRTILVQSFLHKIPPFRSLDQSCRWCGREK